MAPKKKPTLTKIGKHYIDLNEVAGIKQANARLYILKLKNEPNPEFPIWIEKDEIEGVLQHFNIVVND